MIQVGIVSFGSSRCGVGNFTGVYTRVTAYMKWIAEHLEE
jgi:secreted trypsin-like serine protease